MSSMPQSINHPVMEKKTSIIGTITGGRIRKRSGLLGLFSNSKVYLPSFLFFIKLSQSPYILMQKDTFKLHCPHTSPLMPRKKIGCTLNYHFKKWHKVYLTHRDICWDTCIFFSSCLLVSLPI